MHNQTKDKEWLSQRLSGGSSEFRLDSLSQCSHPALHGEPIDWYTAIYLSNAHISTWRLVTEYCYISVFNRMNAVARVSEHGSH